MGWCYGGGRGAGAGGLGCRRLAVAAVAAVPGSHGQDRVSGTHGGASCAWDTRQGRLAAVAPTPLGAQRSGLSR